MANTLLPPSFRYTDTKSNPSASGTNSPSSFSGKDTCTIDRKMVTTVGIQKFYKACHSQQFSNIKLTHFQVENRLNRQACNAGCHYSGYRTSTLRYPEATQESVLENVKKLGKPAEKLTSTVFDFVDEASKVVTGAGRTAMTWADYKRICEENGAVLDMMIHTFKQDYHSHLSLINNPFTKMVVRIVSEYFKYMPEEILYELTVAGHIKIKIELSDIHAVIQAVQSGAVAVDVSQVDTAALLKVARIMANDPALLAKIRKHVKDKITGKIRDKIIEHIATTISVAIGRKIAEKLEQTVIYKELRKVQRKALNMPKRTKSLAEVLKELLVFQGYLQEAADASRELRRKAPNVWNDLRYWHGLDMIYFTAKPFLSEYVDRIHIAQKDPKFFASVVLSLLEPPVDLLDLFLPTA